MKFVWLLVVVMGSAVGFCKCANRFIWVEGHIAGRGSSDLEIIAQTVPNANWEAQPKITVRDGKFSGRVYFDSTKSEGRFTHNCSRVPIVVRLLLIKNGQQVDSIQLNIDKDFTRDKTGDYKILSPVEFRLR